MATLDQNLAAFDAKQAELTEKHNGQWVVFHDAKLAGAFDSFEKAAEHAVAKFGVGPYLIKQVGAPPITLPASVMFRVA